MPGIDFHILAWNYKSGSQAVEMKIRVDNRSIRWKDTWDLEWESSWPEISEVRLACVRTHASMNPLKHMSRSSLQSLL